MKKLLLFFFLVFICWLLSANLVWAVGIGIKPKELNLKVDIGAETETEILITNSSVEPAFYHIDPDAFADTFARKITLRPSDFRLEPGGSQIVKVIVKSWLPGKFATDISVVAYPFNLEGIPVAPGVKVPVVISGSIFSRWQEFLMLISVCLIILFVIELKKSKL